MKTMKAMECLIKDITSGKPLAKRPRPTTQTTGTITMGLKYLVQENTKSRN
jgi:hypothetical protein